MNCSKCGKEIQINFGPQSEPLCSACSERSRDESEPEPLEPAVEECLASQKKRVLNLLLDLVGLYLFTFVLGAVFVLLGLGNVLVEKNATLIGVVIMVAYYQFFETVFAKTPAKFITRTAVVTEDGYRPGFGDIFVRTICRFIPFEAFSFLSDFPVGWHDRFSRTRVVNS